MLIESKTLSYIHRIMDDKSIRNEDIINTLIANKMLVSTDDGTLTFRSEDKNELMHSRVGALTEAFEKFANPSEICGIEIPRVLDLCSGLGYNALAALIKNEKTKIDMVEISRELIFISQFLNLSYKEHDVMKVAVSDFFSNNKNHQITIYNDDARTILKTLPPLEYDVVFHDGFSPANDPVLYTVEFLKLLKSLMKDNAVLLSYSSSVPFRSALIEAGFFIGEGPSIGRQRGITIAAKDSNDNRISKRLSFFDEQLIALSTIGIPFHDKDLQSESEQIKKERENKRQLKKDSLSYISTKKIKKQLIDTHYKSIQNMASDSRTAIIQMKEYYRNL